MSLGNTNDQGNKGNNSPYQRGVADLLKQLVAAVGPAITGYSLEATQLLIKTALQSGNFYGNNANFVSGDSGAITGNTAVQILSSPGAGNFVYITSVLVTNSHATVGTLVSLLDDAAVAIPGASGYAAPAGGGFSITFPTPIKMPAANKKLMAICGTTGANVYVSVVGYKAA